MRVVDVQKGASLFSYKFTKARIPSLSLFRDVLAFSTGENTIEVWNFASGKPLLNIPLRKVPAAIYAASEALIVCALHANPDRSQE